MTKCILQATIAMKKILIDLSKIKNLYSGLGQFSAQFGKHIAEQYAHEYEFHFLVPRNHDLNFSPLIKEIKVSPLLRWWKASHEQYDLWHSLYQFPSYKPSVSFQQMLTIHDLNFIVEKKESKRKAYLKKLKKELQQADCISAISEFTKSQIESHYPDLDKPIHVIHNGVEVLNEVRPKNPDYLPQEDFLFSISLFSAKKNFESLVSMMKFFPNKKLILAGNHHNSYGASIKKKIKELGLEQQVILPGTITGPEKVALYQSCEAFCFPSLAEGFGLPVIEAMQFGKPTFLSNKTSLPEIGGDIAIYFEHFEPKYMADKVKAGLSNYYKHSETQQSKIKSHANQFSWKNSMQKYVNLYHELTQ